MHGTDFDYGEDSVIKPIGHIAHEIERMPMADFARFMINGTVTPELQQATERDFQCSTVTPAASNTTGQAL